MTTDWFDKKHDNGSRLMDINPNKVLKEVIAHKQTGQLMCLLSEFYVSIKEIKEVFFEDARGYTEVYVDVVGWKNQPAVIQIHLGDWEGPPEVALITSCI